MMATISSPTYETPEGYEALVEDHDEEMAYQEDAMRRLTDIAKAIRKSGSIGIMPPSQ